jgi:hypothetical protein
VIEATPSENAEEIEAWIGEIAAAAERIPDEDHSRFLEALAEQKRLAKEAVRREMGLA